MARPREFILAGICFKAQGDLGPLSCYTNRRGIVMFLKAWLRDPASPKQIAHRNRMRQAARNWHAQTNQTRTNYEQASKRGGTQLNGYNLWVYGSMNPDAASNLATLSRQTGIALPPPPPT